MEAVWFLRGGGKVYGPLDSFRLKQLVTEGKIDQRTEVAQSADGPWHPAGNVKGLFPKPEAIDASSQVVVVDAVRATPRNPAPARWYRSRHDMLTLYPIAVLLVCTIGVGAWLAVAFLRSPSKQTRSSLAAVHPARFAHGTEAGKSAAEAWAEEKPDNASLDALANAAAEKAIPKNTALIGSGSDEEREAFTEAFISQFSDTLEQKPNAARKRGEEDGHQAGYLLAKVGKKMPDKREQTEVATKMADDWLGTAEEKRQYVNGFLSQFPVGYRKSK